MKPNEITLFTETTFDSDHHLEGYEGKCAISHGHTWLLQLWIRGNDSQKSEVGILFDFGKIKDIQEQLDHCVINEQMIMKGKNPTAENISLMIYNELKKLYPKLKFKVRLYETAVLKETYCERGDW